MPVRKLGAGKEQDRQGLPIVPIIRHTHVVEAASEPEREPEREPQPQQEREPAPEPELIVQSLPTFSEAAQAPQPSFSPARLQQAAAEVISQLHSAKQELAQELEANLKQLKAVLKETQRIAKDMEAVLKEAKAEPSADELARGGGGGGGGGGNGGKQQKQPWDPPTLKKSAGKQETPDWDAEDDDSDQDQQQQKSQAPQWKPPEDALQPQQH
ncbi:MAG TPA: hypothetical protein VNT01_05100 [Symbiobacteriaceae bacterium]|nr:hypothetical protein [Symbiobacteriaceae bacterium]